MPTVPFDPVYPVGKLFAAGPICTAPSVRLAGSFDCGSRDYLVEDAVRDIQAAALSIAHCDAQHWAAVPMQGSGTMGVEAAVNSFIAPKDKVIVIRNGGFGLRLSEVVKRYAATVEILESPSDIPINLQAVEEFLQRHSDAAAVAMVHSETSTGMLNPVYEVTDLVRRCIPKARVIVDAISSFGGVPMEVPRVCDVLVTSANKCLESLPGLSLIFASKVLLRQWKGNSRSFTLDVPAQWEGLEKTGQFNNTPPVQTLFALREALRLLLDEGVDARCKRYKAINDLITVEMTKFGFQCYITPGEPFRAWVLAVFHTPKCPNWNFEDFYKKLRQRGYMIYREREPTSPLFRLGSLGHISIRDAQAMLEEVRAVCQDMNLFRDAIAV